MEYNYPKFTPEMKKTHTILIPNMAITQFRLLEYALRYDGYKCEIPVSYTHLTLPTKRIAETSGEVRHCKKRKEESR